MPHPSWAAPAGRLLLGVVFALTVAACGDEGSATNPEGRGQVIEPYDTVAVDESLGEGSILALRGARSTSEHPLEVLVDGFSCGRPSRVEVDETDDAVEVVVRGALVGDGDCPADVVAWFVPVELTRPVSGRPVTSGDLRLAVVDCEAGPQDRLCEP